MKRIIHAGDFDNEKPVCGAEGELQPMTGMDYTCKRCEAILDQNDRRREECRDWFGEQRRVV